MTGASRFVGWAPEGRHLWRVPCEDTRVPTPQGLDASGRRFVPDDQAGPRERGHDRRIPAHATTSAMGVRYWVPEESAVDGVRRDPAFRLALGSARFPGGIDIRPCRDSTNVRRPAAGRRSSLLHQRRAHAPPRLGGRRGTSPDDANPGRADPNELDLGRAHQDVAATLFYDRLFELDPTLRRLFRADGHGPAEEDPDADADGRGEEPRPARAARPGDRSPRPPACRVRRSRRRTTTRSEPRCCGRSARASATAFTPESRRLDRSLLRLLPRS